MMSNVPIERQYNLLTPGLAYFFVKAVYDSDRSGNYLRSKSGYPMISVALNVTDSKGITAMIYDYISPNLAWKLDGIKKSCGIIEEVYSNDILAFNINAFLGKHGYCSIRINGQYPDRMEIASYLPPDFHLMIQGQKNNIPKSPAHMAAKQYDSPDRIGMPREKGVPQSQSPVAQIDFNDDDIPF